jgi:hypothetical protein|eukprot:COSAG03_NODE_1098_length_4823_cov_2.610711_3_plen_219_part_00
MVRTFACGLCVCRSGFENVHVCDPAWSEFFKVCMRCGGEKTYGGSAQHTEISHYGYPKKTKLLQPAGDSWSEEERLKYGMFFPRCECVLTIRNLRAMGHPAYTHKIGLPSAIAHTCDDSKVRKCIFCAILYKTDEFTKTGSGQTQVKLKKRCVFLQLPYVNFVTACPKNPYESKWEDEERRNPYCVRCYSYTVPSLRNVRPARPLCAGSSNILCDGST